MQSLVKIRDTYYFRLRVPADLRRYFPSGEIVRSLRTGRYQQAKSLARGRLAEAERLFMTLRANVLTDEMIQQAVTQYLDTRVALFDKGHESDFSQFNNESNDDYEIYEGWHKYLSETFMSTEAGYEHWLEIQKNEIDGFKAELGRGMANENPSIQLIAENIITQLGVEARKGSPEFRRLCTELLKATVKAESVIYEHLKGNFETDYDIKIQSIQEQKAAEQKAISNTTPVILASDTLSAMLSAYCDAYGGVNGAGVRGKLKEKVAKIRECFQVETGKSDILLAAIDYDLTKRVGHRLAKYPLYRNSRYKGKTLKKIALDERVQYPSETTVKEEIFLLSGMYTIALNKLEGLKKNYAMGLSKIIYPTGSKIKTKASSARDIFRPGDISEIIKILGVFKDRGEFEKNPHLLFITLCGLYSGARINEICQLNVDDIIDVDGVTCFQHLEEQDSTKSLKNSNSIRKNPVHPDLIEFGLLRFRDLQKARGFTRLWEFEGDTFPSSERKLLGIESNHSCAYYEKANNSSHYVSKWWNGTFKSKLTLSNAAKQTFHSTRHTFRNWFKQNIRPLDYEALNALTGHLDTDDIAALKLQGYDPDSEGEITYTKELNMRLQLQLLEQLDYNIDLSSLKII